MNGRINPSKLFCVKAVNRTNCAESRVWREKAVVKLSCPKIANGVDWRGGPRLVYFWRRNVKINWAEKSRFGREEDESAAIPAIL